MIMILFSGTQAMAKIKGVIYTAAMLGLLMVLGLFYDTYNAGVCV